MVDSEFRFPDIKSYELYGDCPCFVKRDYIGDIEVVTILPDEEGVDFNFQLPHELELINRQNTLIIIDRLGLRIKDPSVEGEADMDLFNELIREFKEKVSKNKHNVEPIIFFYDDINIEERGFIDVEIPFYFQELELEEIPKWAKEIDILRNSIKNIFAAGGIALSARYLRLEGTLFIMISSMWLAVIIKQGLDNVFGNKES